MLINDSEAIRWVKRTHADRMEKKGKARNSKRHMTTHLAYRQIYTLSEWFRSKFRTPVCAPVDSVDCTTLPYVCVSAYIYVSSCVCMHACIHTALVCAICSNGNKKHQQQQPPKPPNKATIRQQQIITLAISRYGCRTTF